MGKYTSAQVRIYLQEVLRTDSDFNGFCIDHFPDASRRFSNNMDRVAKCNLLFEVVGDPELILEKLLLSHPEIPGSTYAKNQNYAKFISHKQKRDRILYAFATVALVSSCIVIFSFTKQVRVRSPIDLASGGNALLVDLNPATPLPVPHLEQSVNSTRGTKLPLAKKASNVGRRGDQVAPPPLQCESGFVYAADLVTHGLSPCVQRPSVILGPSCSCAVGAVGKRCLLSGFSDVIGKAHLEGGEEQIRNEYRERGMELCQELLGGCRQTKDGNENYVCYCCPEQ